MDWMDNDYRSQFNKLFTALVVPYKKGTYEVDYDEFRKLVRYFLQPKFVDAGGAIIVNPEAGEVFYLSYEEKRKLVEITLEEAKGKVMVFTGAIDKTTELTVADAVAAKELGADGIFFCPPMGSGDVTRGLDLNRHPEVWTDMMRAMIDATGLPMIVHPTAGKISEYGSGIPEGPSLKICKAVPEIVGWKMTYSYIGWYRVAKALRTLDNQVAILGAGANNWHTAFLNDQFDGCVNGSLCYAMEPMLDHIEAWRKNDVPRAKALWKSGLEEIHDYVYGDYARLHCKYKVGAWLRGFVPEPFMRPPQPRPLKDEIQSMKRMLEKLNLPVITDQEIDSVLRQL